MRTVQDCLKTVNIDELVNAYIERSPITTGHLQEEKEVYCADLLCAYQLRIKELVKHLCELDPKENKDGAILYAYDCVEGDFKEPAFSLVHINDLKKIGLDAHGYAYEFCEQAEIIGFYVAETEMTNKYMVDLLVDVLYEATFFGFEQEELSEKKQELEEALKEVESGNFKSIPAEEVFKDFGIEREKEDDEEQALQEAFYKAKMKYNDYLRKKELEKVIDLIKA